MSSLLVIIVTYNAMRWANRCFNNLRLSNYPVDVFVVDNGSEDGTQEFITNNFPDVTFYQSNENLGFGRANNLGLKYAIEKGYKFVYLLNQDAWVDENVFDDLIKIKEDYPEFGVLSPMQLTGDGSQLDRNFRFNVDEKRCPNMLRDIDSHQEKDVYETSFVMAAHWFLAIDDLKKVGLFSPAFSHYGEDGNLVARFKYWGYKIGVCPKLRAYHDRQYREVSPEKRLYLCFTSFLESVNNPVDNNYPRKIVKFIRDLFLLREVDLRTRLNCFFKGLKE